MNLDPFYSYNPPSLPFEQLLSVLFTNVWYNENQPVGFLTHTCPHVDICVHTAPALLLSVAL